MDLDRGWLLEPELVAGGRREGGGRRPVAGGAAGPGAAVAGGGGAGGPAGGGGGPRRGGGGEVDRRDAGDRRQERIRPLGTGSGCGGGQQVTGDAEKGR